MDKKSIIQWNCRGLRANYNEILILMSLFSPSVICLQETFLKQSDNISFRDFNMFNHICPDGQWASGGTSIMVKSSVPHSQFDLNTNLQAVAVNVECKTAINKRKSALRKFNKNPSRENHMHSKLARAKARRTIKDAKRTSWRQYVNKLNSRTPIKKVWDMIRKVSGKNKKCECVHIKSSNGNM